MLEDRLFTCIHLSHLQILELYGCHFGGENVLNKILSGCPELEVFKVCCKSIGSLISISCNPRLKYVCIADGGDLKRIEIFTPSLETFKIIPQNPCAIQLATCTALKHLRLKHAHLSAHHLPIQYLLSKLVCIESLKLDDCKALGELKISSPCLKRLSMRYFLIFPSAKIDFPNLLDLHLCAWDVCNLDFKFSSWNVPKVEKVHMVFSFKSFWSFCRAGLESFIMKLHNYESLKLLIAQDSCTQVQNFILHEKLHAVPFSSLNEFIIQNKPEYVVISSREEEHFFLDQLYPGHFPVRLSLIFSSRQSIELLFKQLSKAERIQRLFTTFQLLSTEEIEHEMDSVWKSFLNTHSSGYQTATIIFN